MSTPHDAILIIGGGGHAVVVADAAIAAGMPVQGFLDDRPDARLASRLERVGGFSLLQQRDLVTQHPIILGLGDLSMRRDLIGRLEARLATVIHPTAIVSSTATIGAGVYIGPGAIVHVNARIEDHAIINSGAIVEHDGVVGVNAHVAPNATLGGDVAIGSDTLVGIGSTVLPGVHIGDGCTIGAGSSVIHDVEHGRTVVGVPARDIE